MKVEIYLVCGDGGTQGWGWDGTRYSNFPVSGNEMILTLFQLLEKYFSSLIL